MKLILASSSPRRRDILRVEGYDIEVVDPTADEVEDGDPFIIVVENARSKARSVHRDGIVREQIRSLYVMGRYLGNP